MQISAIYDVMYQKMGEQPWLEEWQESPWEVIYGGILVQNTSWVNVAPSLMNLKKNFNFDPQQILELSTEALQKQIRPSGFYTRKAQTIQNVLMWAQQYQFSIEKIQKLTSTQLRSELLALVGIGPETADYLMMYAFGHAGFIADKYSQRIFEWFGHPLPIKYEQAKNEVEEVLDLTDAEWQNFHAMIVNSGKEIKSKEDFVNEYINSRNRG